MPHDPSLGPGANPIVAWNDVALEAITLGPTRPTVIARALNIVHSAIYEAWAAYDPHAAGSHVTVQVPAEARSEAAALEAVNHAAFRALLAQFPNAAQQQVIKAHMTALGLSVDNVSTDPSTPAGIGNLAAKAVLDFRAADGSNAVNNFADTTGYVPVNGADPNAPNAPGGASFDPNHWQPLRVPTGAVRDQDGNPIVTDDPASFTDQRFLTPQWGSVTPYALTSGDQFRPQAPPKLGDFSPYTDGLGHVTTNDQAYRDQASEILQISADLTPTQKVIAEFWADGPRSFAPPGHWNELAQGFALRDDMTLGESVVFFYALNNALLDASIVAWDAKRAYDYIRPQSAIQDLYFDQEIDAWAGPNQGTQTILGQDFRAYQDSTFVTPPFPEFTSGHSTFSAAAARVIELFTGSATFFDGVTTSNLDLDNNGVPDLLGQVTIANLKFEDYDGPPIVLTWDTVWEAADEAGISRRYGGIHFQDGDLFARAAGKQVGGQAFADTFAQANGLQFGTEADDTIACTDNDDCVFGGNGDDSLAGAGGNDTLIGDGGDDSLSCDAGDDVSFAGLGADSIGGGAGADILVGEAGADTLEGGAGNDGLFAGDGNDSLAGADGADLASGEAGNDVIAGGGGVDTLFGGAGNDRLTGDDGADVLVGDDGADTLAGGAGNDALFGGTGADLFAIGGGVSPQDAIFDFVRAQGDKLRIDAIPGLPFPSVDAVVANQVNQNGNTLLTLGVADGQPQTVLVVGVTAIVAGDFVFG